MDLCWTSSLHMPIQMINLVRCICLLITAHKIFGFLSSVPRLSLVGFFGAPGVNATNRRQHTRVTETYTTTTSNHTSGESAFDSDSEVFSWSVSGASSPYNIIQLSVLVVSAFLSQRNLGLSSLRIFSSNTGSCWTYTDQVRYL